MRLAVITGLILLSAGAAQAQPDSCTGREAYVGSALHAPPAAQDWPQPATFSPAAFPDATPEALQAALDRAVAASAVQSITVAVWRPGLGFWASRHEADGVEPRPLHWWASAGKMVTAASVLQLVEEGRIDLDDPVTRWRNDVEHGRFVTVERLLNHTSGLFSANEDLAFRNAPHRMTLDEDLEIAARNGPLFCPGQAWRYSNTGYALLGAIIAAEDGRSYEAAAQARTFARLGIEDAVILGEDSSLDRVQPLGPAPAGEAGVDPRWPGAAGGVAATPQAMIQLLHGLLTGGLLTQDSVHAMLAEPHQMFGSPTWYGLGLMLYDVPTGDGGRLYWIGHSGGAPGVRALVIWSPVQGAYVAVALTGEGSPEATANLLLQALA